MSHVKKLRCNMALSSNEVKATMLAVLATGKRWPSDSDFKNEKEDITDINTVFLLLIESRHHPNHS